MAKPGAGPKSGPGQRQDLQPVILSRT